MDKLGTIVRVTSSWNWTRFTLICLWIFPPRQQNLILDRCRSNYTQLDTELSFARIDDASLNLTTWRPFQWHFRNHHDHRSYLLLLFIVVSWVLDVVDVLKLLICPRTKLSSCETRRHCVNIALCSCYSLSGLSQRSHVKIFMFVAPYWLHFAL